MRLIRIGAAAFAVLAAGVAAPGVSGATTPNSNALEQAARAHALADSIRAALFALGPNATKEQALQAIYAATAGADLRTIADALALLRNEAGFGAGAREALAEAQEIARLAMAATGGATGGVPSGSGVGFSVGGVGAPGGGGGSGYH